MRILLTGASSFTGFWFAKTLAEAGHEVVATFRRGEADYDEVRGRRVRALDGRVEPIWGVEFGDERFLDAAQVGSFDLLCHHAAEVRDYRSWDFDALEASRRNTRNARRVLAALADQGCRRLIVTGSVFEPLEGIGDPQRRAFNPYGLSKHLTFELLRLEAERLGWSLGKFVIPNPFGPFEELRFTSYLAREWAAGREPSVATPVYVRDNIHVSLLARAYLAFCEALSDTAGLSRADPSGYIESQGAFAQRFAREIGERLGRTCVVTEADQTDFPEPLIRVNSSPAAAAHPEWSEAEAWDGLFAYYEESFFRPGGG